MFEMDLKPLKETLNGGAGTFSIKNIICNFLKI
jgi:hypothetical protein